MPSAFENGTCGVSDFTRSHVLVSPCVSAFYRESLEINFQLKGSAPPLPTEVRGSSAALRSALGMTGFYLDRFAYVLSLLRKLLSGITLNNSHVRIPMGCRKNMKPASVSAASFASRSVWPDSSAGWFTVDDHDTYPVIRWRNVNDAVDAFAFGAIPIMERTKL